MNQYITIYDMEEGRVGIAGLNIDRTIRGWEIILIVVLGIVGIVLIILLIVFCIKFKRKL